MATLTMTTHHTPTPRFQPFVRVAVGLQTATILAQAISAGLAFTTSYGELLHSVGARVTYGATMLYVLAAVLAWRPGGGSARPVLYATGFLLLSSLQVVAGVSHWAGLHVPLGVLMFGGSLLRLGLDLARYRADAAAAGDGGVSRT
ncbi:hypothetical protein ACIRBX_02040 [Kitasatospora sp. NPDC096147]|uniref:hypothetical protein n=1 Tax=Kitasatospora sp. NPDC096147 TaxID=3364093 RepID=UPI0038271F87